MIWANVEKSRGSLFQYRMIPRGINSLFSHSAWQISLVLTTLRLVHGYVVGPRRSLARGGMIPNRISLAGMNPDGFYGFAGDFRPCFVLLSVDFLFSVRVFYTAIFNRIAPIFRDRRIVLGKNASDVKDCRVQLRDPRGDPGAARNGSMAGKKLVVARLR
uniref:Uncharacterized protein n=1 Tax=Candidatus Kentrum sp. FW TaxID=2126338 RepID=A0A450TZ72_9GAMM|nr:MAG: hypothetical protein BECKFW1821C_GA0114237_107214 [Candidatus Kentron sp. FW]